LANAIRSWSATIAVAGLAVALAGGFGDAAAQQAGTQPQQPPAPVVKATHGDWVVRCQKLKVAVNAPAEGTSGKTDKTAQEVRDVEQCGMSQRVFDEKNKKIFLNVVVLKRTGEKAPPGEIQLVAPLGVFLPGGVGMEVDTKPIGRIGFLSCQPYGCVTVSEITPELLDQMRKGTAANMIIYIAPGQGIPLSVSLKGFSKAFDEL
jgi:invasion protein IalB